MAVATSYVCDRMGKVYEIEGKLLCADLQNIELSKWKYHYE